MVIDSESLVPDLHRLPKLGNAASIDIGFQNWRDAGDKALNADITAFIDNTINHSHIRPLLAAIFGHSPYLTHCLLSDTEFAVQILADGPQKSLNKIFACLTENIGACISSPDLMALLRQSRKKVSLAVGISDIAGLLPLRKITGELSAFAEIAIECALSHLLLEGVSSGEVQLNNLNVPTQGSGFIVLGMGKLGARELNYSSDIDLILLFDPERIQYTGNQTPQQFYIKLARQLVRILEQRTGDGYVFRTDLRLRPDPGSTPLVMSTLAAETYYESTGQNWERAAMIKARPVAGDKDAGEKFLKDLTPFIWRKNLDFAAIQDIHSIKRQINAVKGGKQITIAGHNVKLGRGGIREIEFYAQTQQLIWGGRNPSLRAKETCQALKDLAAADHIKSDVPRKLEKAYEFLRMTEHRLQMIDDQQTHEIPTNRKKLANFSSFMGFSSTEAFANSLSKHLLLVEDLYAALFDDTPDLSAPGTLVFTGGEDHPDTLKTLEQLGFKEPHTVSATIRAWHHGRYRALRSTRAKELLTELVPSLLQAFSETLEPDAAFLRFSDFLSRLPAGIQILSFLYTNPAVLHLLADIMGSAPRLAETLLNHPILFDSVLTSDFFEDTPSSSLLISEIANALIQAGDFQDVLDVLRRQINDRLFQVGVHILRRRLTPTMASSPLSNIADAALNSLYPNLLNEFAEQHGQMINGEMAIVALGNLGSRELTIGSDLDLLFIYNCSDVQSDGIKPLSPIPYFNKLGQRYLGALSSPTAEGLLYEVDLRLRPSGNAGPLASSFDSFVKYHHESAWTWEHMALTRARIVVAEDSIRIQLRDAIQTILTLKRNPDVLLRDVAGMRERIESDRPALSPWDMKNRRGGLVDIEFIAQYLQLKFASERPEILDTNTENALEKLTTAKLLDKNKSVALITALRLWRNIQGVVRLSVGENFDKPNLPDGCRNFIANASGCNNFEQLQFSIAEKANECHKIYRDLIEEPFQKLAARAEK